MHISIMNSTFPLEFDIADDAPPEWKWSGLTPLCPVCLKKGRIHPLLVPGKEDTKLAPVEPGETFDTPRVVCDACRFMVLVQS